MKINRAITLNIGGQERQCKLTIGMTEELESLLPNRNVFELGDRFNNNERWAINEIVSVCYCGLKTYDRTLTRRKVAQWVEEYAQEFENGIADLNLRLFACLGLSGIIGGEPSAFQSILNNLDEKNVNGIIEEFAEKK